MNPYEIGIIVVGALVGWWLVSWIIDKVRANNARPSLFNLPDKKDKEEDEEGGKKDDKRKDDTALRKTN